MYNTMEIKREIDFDDIMEECTSKQEQDILETIKNNNKENELIQLLIESGVETMDGISDIIYHDWQWVFDELEIDEDEEEED